METDRKNNKYILGKFTSPSNVKKFLLGKNGKTPISKPKLIYKILCFSLVCIPSLVFLLDGLSNLFIFNTGEIILISIMISLAGWLMCPFIGLGLGLTDGVETTSRKSITMNIAFDISKTTVFQQIKVFNEDYDDEALLSGLRNGSLKTTANYNDGETAFIIVANTSQRIAQITNQEVGGSFDCFR